MELQKQGQIPIKRNQPWRINIKVYLKSNDRDRILEIERKNGYSRSRLIQEALNLLLESEKNGR